VVVVPDLLWDDVRDWFNPDENEMLPDVRVPDTTAADWQAVVDLLRSRGWGYEYSEDGEVRRVPDRVEDVLGRTHDLAATLKVWPVPGFSRSLDSGRRTRSTSMWIFETCKGRAGWTWCVGSCGRSGAGWPSLCC
jgi:hypothetical protein